MDSNSVYQILNGRFDHLPKPKSKVVRIFLSSTFSDFHTERDYLIEKIYPKLKSYCKSKYGLDFTVLDMRWGISHEITNSHTTTSICLNEITSCQKYSAGPNFIALLSHRYGARSLPERILATEYETLKNGMTNDLDLKFKYDENPDANIQIDNLFEHCYELDENEQPSRYRLVRLEKCFPNYNPKKEIFETVWNLIEKKLGNILRKVAKQCFDKGVFNVTQYERFFVSVTEKEIFKGILTAKNVPNNVLFFNRNITDIKEKIKDNVSLANKFIELNKNKEPDEEICGLLDNLKYKKIPEALPSSNIFNFDVNWSTTSGISRETHEEYVIKFGELFYEQVKLLIDRNQEKLSLMTLDQKKQTLLQEVLDHAYFCNETAEKFRGRVDILNKVKEYILSDNKKPLLIYGDSGCGKTAIVAKITSEILSFVPDPANCSLIMRFLGTTPLSSNIISTFNSIVYQLSKLFLLPVPIKKITSKEKLALYLLDLLNSLYEIDPSKKVVILLDSVDQLDPDDYSLNWVWEELPPNTKLIFSTIPSHGSLLDSFKTKINLEDDNLIEITSLDQPLAKMILTDFLKKSNRTLSPAQWDVITNQMFPTAKLFPLYVTILFDIVSKWSSTVVPDNDFFKCLHIDKCIEYLFKYLEGVHGKLLFSRAIIYMSSFKNGISESEIEDILSLDDQVLYDIFEFHAPPVRKLPVALWSRIKYDLKGYMVEKEVQDTRVIYWYHRRFIEVTSSHYISKLSSQERDTIFSNVVDFYNETWKHKPKPYKYNEFVAKKKKLNSTETAEVRDTSIQPTMFIDGEGNVRFNQRKIFEMPGFVAGLASNLAPILACDYIYFDYYFVTGLFKLVSFFEIMDNLKKITEGSSYNATNEANSCRAETKLLNLINLQCGLSMKDYPDSAVDQILNRSINLRGQCPHLIKLINDYDKAKSQLNSLVLPYQQLNPPGSDVIFTLDKHTTPLTCVSIGGDNDGFLFTLSNKLHLLSMSEIIELGEITLTKDPSIEYSFMIIFFEDIDIDMKTQIKSIPGFFIVSTRTDCTAYNFNSNQFFQKSFSYISNIHLVGPNHLVILERDQSHFDIYDLKSGQVFYRKQFDHKIKESNCSSHKRYLNDRAGLKSKGVWLTITLANNEVEIFRITMLDENDQQVEVKHFLQIPSFGIDVSSISFIKQKPESYETEGARVSYTNSAIVCVNFNEFNEDNKLMVLKPELNKPKQVSLKFLNQIEAKNKQHPTELYLGTDKHLYIVYYMTEINSYLIGEIEGNFDGGKLLSNGQLIALNKGTAYFYLIDIDVKINDTIVHKECKYLKVAELNAHFDDINFLFQNGPMYLTASRDSTVKVFVFTKLKNLEKTQIKINRSSNTIASLHYVSESVVAAQLEASNCVDFWDLRNGTILESIRSAETISDIFVMSSRAVIICQSSGGSKLIIKGLAINEKVSKYSECGKEEFRIEIDRSDFHRAFQSSSSIVILTESSDSKITLYSLDYDDLKAKKPISPISIKLDQLTNNQSRFLKNACLAYSGLYAFLYYEQSFYVIESRTGQLLVKEKIPNNTSTPIDVSCLTSFEDTDAKLECIVARDSLTRLLLIQYNSQSRKLAINVINYDSKPVSVDSFKVNKNLLIVHSKQDSQILVCSTNSLVKANKIDEIVFDIKLNKENPVLIFGLSLNNQYAYLVENRKILRFFNIKSKKEITGSGMPLYGEPRKILCTNDYVSIAMQDDRVISFLISEPERSDNLARLQDLPSRKQIDKELDAKMKAMMDAIDKIMDSDSDDEDDLHEILDKSSDDTAGIDISRLKKRVKNGVTASVELQTATSVDELNIETKAAPQDQQTDGKKPTNKLDDADLSDDQDEEKPQKMMVKSNQSSSKACLIQ